MRGFSILRSLVLVLSAGLVQTCVAALPPVTDLHIVNKVISPDGYPREAVLAEGVFPGPPIIAQKGSRFRINVIDELTNTTMLTSTSIHWHGVFQHGTNWADGATFVNQCPITTGNSFLYSFTAPGQAGTFWYHSHHAVQYCDGLRGALVIKDPFDPFARLYDVDNEATIITLADWYHTAAPNIKGAPQPASTLINGKGRYVGGPASDLAVITVQRGKRYRMRLLNIACDPNYTFSIDSHNTTIIEVDGVNHQPHTVDSIQIFASQRYSFILDANQPVGNYWIRAMPNIGPSGYNGGINSAILRYVGAPNKEPNSTAPSSPSAPLNEVDLHPLVNPRAPGRPGVGKADKNINLALGFSGGAFTMNGVSFVPPNVPVLLQILSGVKKPEELLPHGSIIGLPPYSVIELSLPGGTVATTGPHPFHLHGHAFSVVRSAGSSTYNYDNPVRRDTVNIGADAGDNVTIRFETNNPGPWFLHCHIEFHLQGGLAIVLSEATQHAAIAAQPIPAAWNKLCPDYYGSS